MALQMHPQVHCRKPGIATSLLASLRTYKPEAGRLGSGAVCGGTHTHTRRYTRHLATRTCRVIILPRRR